MHLYRLDDTNYPDYQRCVRKIEYSYSKKGEPQFPYAALFAELTKNEVCPTPEFIKYVNDPNIEIYCLRNEDGQNMGLACIQFKKREAHIDEFALLNPYKGQGNGKAFYNMILEESIYPRRCKEITLNCPFAGAQEFWIKQGFHFVDSISMRGPYPLMRKKLR